VDPWHTRCFPATAMGATFHSSVLILGVILVCAFGALADAPIAEGTTIRHVNRTDTSCGGRSPCYGSIQAAVNAAQDIVTVKGPTGSGVAVDTSRCLHLGSRVSPGAFRLVLYLQYCTTREITNVFDVDRFRHDRVKHLAVAHSVEQGRALADKYEMGG